MTKAQGRLIIICGLPGAGKTTLAKQIENSEGALRLCPDDWLDALSVNLHDEPMRARVEGLQWQLCQRMLLLGLCVIIEWGTWGRGERDNLREGARRLGATVELHCLSAAPEVLYHRIAARGQETPAITYADVLSWSNLFEVPTPDELAMYDSASFVVAYE
jgi:predicted kinase